MLHLGANHFGDINFDLSGMSGDTKDCTCALCQRNSLLHQLNVSLPHADMALPENELEFNRHPLQHYFCLTTDTGQAESRNLTTPSDFDYCVNAAR